MRSKVFVVCIALLALQQSLAAQTTQPTRWKLTDLQALVDANWNHVTDIQYKYETTLSAVLDPTYREVTKTTTRWNGPHGWERRESQVQRFYYPHGIHRLIQGWDGTLAQYFDAEESEAGSIWTAPQPKGFSGDDPLDDLAIRSYGITGEVTIGKNLDSKDVLVEGEEQIDGHQTVLINVNLDPTHPRTASLLIRYWLDPAAGGMPRRVELWLRGKRVRISSKTTPAEVAPGFFFPVSYTVKMMEGKGIFKGGSTIDFVIDPKSVKLNPGFKQADYAVPPITQKTAR